MELLRSDDRSDDIATLRQSLVDYLIDAGCIHTPSVEEAFRKVPRHLFLPDVALDQVYRDQSVPTKRIDGQVVSSSSQPAIIATMLEQLDLKPGHRVLEIGAGTGYNEALIAHAIGNFGQVVTADIDEDLTITVRKHLAAARPSSEGFRIRAYPHDTDYAPSANEFVVQKERTQLVLHWN